MPDQLGLQPPRGGQGECGSCPTHPFPESVCAHKMSLARKQAPENKRNSVEARAAEALLFSHISGNARNVL